jgi:hypothetical protein
VDWDGRALLQEVREVARERVARAPIHKVQPLAASTMKVALHRD